MIESDLPRHRSVLSRMGIDGALSWWPLRRPPLASLLTPMLLMFLGSSAVVLYAPMLAAPLEIRDYSEFLLLVPENRHLGSTFSALTTYFFGHGRFLPLTHGFIALNWTLFGLDSVGWQLMRSGLMGACAAAAFVLLRRLGATKFSAAAGTALFVVAPGATAAWIRLSGEPIATLALLTAAILATEYRRTARWHAAGFAIALLSALATFAKETSIAAVPFVIALAWFAPRPETDSHSAWDARGKWLLLMASAALAAALAPIATIALSAQGTPDSYVSQYGETPMRLSTFIRRWLWMALPFPPFTAPTRLHLLRLPPNLVFCGLLAIGGLVSLESPRLRRIWGRAAIAAVTLPLAGAAAYQPWPRFESLYALPFIFGSSLALAISLSALERLRPRAAILAYLAYLIPLGYMTLLADETVARTAATRTVNSALVARIAARPSGDSVLVADPYPPKQKWQGHGATLGRYARAVSAGRAPAVEDVSCARADSASRMPGRRIVIISYSDLCGTLPRSSEVMRSRFRYFSWRSMSAVRDSIRADVFVSVARPLGSLR